jgi:hypothetical protein
MQKWVRRSFTWSDSRLFRVRVGGFGRSLVGGGGVLMGHSRSLVGFGRVLVTLFVVAFAVVFGCEVVMLGCFSVVLCGLFVCFVCHFGFPVGNLPARSYAPACEFVAAWGRRFTGITGN